MKQVNHRNYGCSMLASIQGQAELDFKAFDLVKDVPCPSQGVGLGGL